MAAAAAALRSARSYAINATMTQGGTTQQLQMDYGGPQRISVQLNAGAGPVRMILLGDDTYINASAQFWRSQGPATRAIASELGGKWIALGASAGKGVLSGLGHLSPEYGARCLTEDHGTLSVAGTTTVSGQPAVVIKDAGNKPGSQPGTLAVAATGTPYPLRIASSGRQQPGHTNVCNNSGSSVGTATLSDFDNVPAITAPAGAIKIP